MREERSLKLIFVVLKSRSVTEMGFQGRRGLASVFIELILSASSLERSIAFDVCVREDDMTLWRLTTLRKLLMTREGVKSFRLFQVCECLYHH